MLTIQDVNLDGRSVGVAGLATVLPRVRGLRCLYEEPGGGDVTSLFGYHRDASPGTVVAQGVLIVVPEDVGWRLRAEVYGARQVYRAASAHVQIWTTQYRRCRHCDKERILPLSPFLSPSSPAAACRPTLALPTPLRQLFRVDLEASARGASWKRYESRDDGSAIRVNEQKLVTGPRSL